MHISQRLSRLKPSATIAITTKARELRAEGQDVIVLAAGEPDFTPPSFIREAVAREATEGLTRYGPAPGSLDVRKALSSFFESTRGLDYAPEQIVMTNGGKHALYNALAALVDPGDEVLILAPYWVTYPAQVELLDGTPRFVSADDRQGFKVTPDQLRDALTDRTRCIIFNNPSNPTGAYYSADEVTALTEVCVEAGVAIVSDEVYDAITFGGGPYLSPAAVSEEAKELTVIASSLSKAYAMPGWRIGYVVGPTDWIKKVASFQGQATHHPSALAQAAATAALTGDQGQVEEMRAAFQARRDYLLEAFDALPGFEIAVAPQGAFYLFPSVMDLIAALPDADNSVDACTWLLDEALVALVPGSAFGAEGFLRLSYAASDDDLKRSVERIGEAIGKLGL
jgi:aspartate aminotransferase